MNEFQKELLNSLLHIRIILSVIATLYTLKFVFGGKK